MTVAVWSLRAACAFVTVASLAPLLRVGWWPVRLCDFPRMQIGVASVGVALGAGALLLLGGWRWDHGAALALGVMVAAWQLRHVLPYTPLWSKQAPDAPPGVPRGDVVRIAVLNLNFENGSKGQAAPIFRSLDADLLVLIEIDDEWQRALEGLAREYPAREGDVRGDGLGLAVWSRLPLRNATVRHLATDRRASVWARLELPDERTAEFVAVHPAPPGLKRDDGEREDSRKRDAELVLVAREVAEQRRGAHIVAGDFNDVAWSHTTRLFERISGLRDPRKGRSLLSTYHADHPLFRYPIDHVFVSEGFAIGRLERVRIPGSDHLGVVTDLVLLGEQGVDPRPQGNDRAEAKEIVEEGIEDAEEDGER